ncbi:MAG TPA: neutral/alkaline non-lysosomal ceramidase N-terminal domain-containing protein [bacterium]|nr:neutral/alkaline non-lysosomal ceramidase N-terminal domain-containing protein [bacterium]
MSKYEVGFSVIELTPPVGTPIGGNFRADYASRGVIEPLLANAMVVRDENTAVAMVSADLLTVPQSMTEEVRQRVSQRCPLPGENILIAATHTHSGPATLELTDGSLASQETLQGITRAITDAIVKAYWAMEPSIIRLSRFTEDSLVFNRRLRMKDGSVRMNWERMDPSEIDGPLGPTDPEGFMVSVSNNGRLRGLLINYALHPAVLAGENWDLGPDWPGFLREALARYVGGDVPILYFNGTQGNINHLDAWDPLQGRGLKEAQRIGYVLATAAVSSSFQMQRIDGPVAVSSEELLVNRRSVSAQTVADAEKRLAALGTLTVEGQEDGMPSWFFDKELVEHAGRQNEPVSLEVQAIRIGDIGFAGFPGEFFVEYGLELKRHSPAEFTIPLGLANGEVGYVPTPEAPEQGGYEGMTWRYNQLEADAGEKVVHSAIRQMERLFEKGRVAPRVAEIMDIPRREYKVGA